MPSGTPTPSTRYRVSGLSLDVVEAGPAEGPVALLLHGFPEFWRGWRHQIGPLAQAGFRVVVPDQRGYNLSDKPQGVAAYALDELAADVVSLVEALGRDKVALVGHDWGGIVAWWVAARHPDLVERLAILNAPHPDIFLRYVRQHPVQAVRSLYIGFFQLPWLPEAALRAGRFRALRHALQRSSRKGTFEPEDLRAYEEAWSQPGALTGMLNWYRALRQWRPKGPRAGRVRCPTLILWGTGDQALERGLATESLRRCDDGRVIWFEEATHWVQHEEPERVNAALTDFLKTGHRRAEPQAK